jgi:uncharacterized protein HemY
VPLFAGILVVIVILLLAAVVVVVDIIRLLHHPSASPPLGWFKSRDRKRAGDTPESRSNHRCGAELKPRSGPSHIGHAPLRRLLGAAAAASARGDGAGEAGGV